ncbi:ROK family protein [Jeotgalibacillus sp. S-D1]|uniref:ROK family protein n=1 Tax=Jeotgalibacillus sp. S-D1 TaxID=2552189 RepID=UPI001059E1D2|nr:ROK family protein [Jeotgalibacillus sp. S-D1]TDL31972.1 ROK family protein [Jeotgalibacillus sp. S-D1]
MRSYLPNDIKDENRKIIFDILLQNPNLAKVEITEKTAMSFVTVSKVVNFFDAIGLVTATGESREGSGGLGRKRTVYRFNENSYVTIGIQKIGSMITALLVNLYGKIIDCFSMESDIPFYSTEFASIFEEIVDWMRKKAAETNSTILGIGIGVDGAINNQKKTIRMRVAENKEENFRYEVIVGNLTERVKLPIYLENDVNASAVAEFRSLDPGLGVTDLIHIAAGEGIGAGLIINKELYRGFNASAGELEYMCFDPDYKRTSSSVGWLEGRLGLENLEKEYDVKSAVDRSKLEDFIASHIALTIANIISILGISHIIVSGKTIALSPERILANISKYVDQYANLEPVITYSASPHSAAIGAAVQALQNEVINIISV